MFMSRIATRFAIALIEMSRVDKHYTIRPGDGRGHVMLIIDDKDDDFFDGLAASIGMELVWLRSDGMPQAHWLKQLMEAKALTAAREEKIKKLVDDCDGLKWDNNNLQKAMSKPQLKALKAIKKPVSKSD